MGPMGPMGPQPCASVSQLPAALRRPQQKHVLEKSDVSHAENEKSADPSGVTRRVR